MVLTQVNFNVIGFRKLTNKAGWFSILVLMAVVGYLVNICFGEKGAK